MDYLKTFQDVLELEAQALQKAQKRLNRMVVEQTVEVFERLTKFGGCLVFCGVGKSGQIAQKLVSTFLSLGQRSFYLHPVEALHGDIGGLGPHDALVLISKSGTTEEIVKLLPFLKVQKEMMIGLIGNVDSKLADACGVVLDCSVDQEACINNLAPTTSSTLALAMGDAMAVVYEKVHNLSVEKFAANHPGGLLGKSLVMKVEDLMWRKTDCPQVEEDASLQDIILAMTQKPAGACAVVDDSGKLRGLIMEADIRRTFVGDNRGLNTLASEIMNPKPTTVGPETLAYDALKLMEDREKPFYVLPIVSQASEFIGFIRTHDLLQAGFSLNS